MHQGRILVVEDDRPSAEVLEAYLQREGYVTQQASDGVEALEQYARWQPDLVLLDLMLPGLRGSEVMRAIRHRANTPLIMVSAVNKETERIDALLYGADDYVVKPYHPGEVVARVHAVLRRSRERGHQQQATRLRHKGIVLDQQAAQAYVEAADGQLTPLELTRTEHNLLSRLLLAPGKVFARAELLAACQPDSDALERVVDAHVYNLRRKLEQAGVAGVLVTVRGIGYRLGNAS